MKRLIAAGLLLVIFTSIGTYLATSSGFLPWRETKPLLTKSEAVNVVLALLNDGPPFTVGSSDYNIISRFRSSDVNADARYEAGRWIVTIYGVSASLEEQVQRSDSSIAAYKKRLLNVGTYVVDDRTGKVTGP